MSAVLQTMVDEDIGPGVSTETFVSKLKETAGFSSGAAVRTYPGALYHALLASGIGKDDTIAVSALSPEIYRHVAAHIGCKLVVCDIDEETGVLSYDEAFSQTIQAAILFEPVGNIPLDERWSQCGIPLIEDISESIGSYYGEKQAGKIGKIAVCACEQSSLICTGGGAVILSSDPELQKQLDDLLAWQKPYGVLQGMNAALGIMQLDRMTQNIERRRMIYDRYRQAVMHTRHHIFGIQDIDFTTNAFAFAVVIDGKVETAVQFALRYEVESVPVFQRCLIVSQKDCFDRYPHAAPCMARSLKFPLYPFLTQQQILQVEKVLSHLP